MKIKVTIKENSEAARKLDAMKANKENFKQAAQRGQAATPPKPQADPVVQPV